MRQSREQVGPPPSRSPTRPSIAPLGTPPGNLVLIMQISSDPQEQRPEEEQLWQARWWECWWCARQAAAFSRAGRGFRFGESTSISKTHKITWVLWNIMDMSLVGRLVHQHHHHHRKQGEDNSSPDGSPDPPRLRGPLLCRLHSGKKLRSFFLFLNIFILYIT